MRTSRRTSRRGVIAWRNAMRARPSLQRVVGDAVRFAARGSLLLLLSLTGSHVPSLTPATLEVDVAGCEMVRLPPSDVRGRGVACELGGPSIFAGARGQAEPGVVTIWARTSPGDDPVVAVDGSPARTEWHWVRSQERDGDGRRAQIPVEKGAHEIAVSAGYGQRRNVVRLPIVTAADSDDQRALVSAIKDRITGVPGVRMRLDRLTHSADAAVRGRALGQIARIEDKPARFQDALEEDRKAGLVSDEVADTIALAYNHIRAHALAQATEALDDIERRGRLAAVPEGRAMVPHYRALIAAAQGDLGEARRLDDESERLALRLDLRGHLTNVYQAQIDTLDQLGSRGQEMNDDLAKMEATKPSDPRELARWRTNLGWHELLAAGPGPEHDGERRKADVDLESAQRLFGKGGVGADECALQNVLVNRAHIALDLAENGETERHLGEAERFLSEAGALCVGDPKNHLAEWNVHAGRLALAREQHPAARLHFAEARMRSRATVLPRHEIAAILGLAEVEEVSGAVDGALALYREADERLNRWSALIPFGDGKRDFLGSHSDGVRRRLDLLLQQLELTQASGADHDRRVREMACVARASVARPLLSAQWTYSVARSSPETHDRWQEARKRYEEQRAELVEEAAKIGGEGDVATREQGLAKLAARGADIASALDRAATEIAGAPPAPTCEEGASSLIAGPGEGEAILVYHPLKENDWIGIYLTRERAMAHRFHLAPADIESLRGPGPKDVASRLIAPFADALRGERQRVGRIRIFAAEPLGSIDLHDLATLDDEGHTLGERFVTSYGVDLPPLPPASSPVPGKRALVVIPDLQIAGASLDAEHVVDALTNGGWKVQLLEGPQATRAAVRAELQRGDVALFHFFGHAHAAGRDAWESRLVLSGGDWLSLPDVMTLDHAPRLVVLASCDGAATTDSAYVQGPTLAHAFIMAGAEHVIGSPSESDASATDDVVSELYGRHLPALLQDPAAALREALDGLRDLHARPDMKGVHLPRMRVIAR